MNDAERTVKLDLREISPPTSKRPVLVVLQGQSIGLTAQLEKEQFVIGRGSAADDPEGIVQKALRDLASEVGTATVFESPPLSGAALPSGTAGLTCPCPVP